MILEMLKEGCRVGFFGIGKSNLSLLSCLPLEKCKVTLRSDRKIHSNSFSEKAKIERILCEDAACADINEDILFFSPSVRRDRAEFINARERGVIFSSDAELFFEENRKPIYAVTGSDGKSTTATMINMLLQADGIDSRLIGNIGEPMAKWLWKRADAFVCELSSFMLEYASPMSRAACITNITPNHLDWHEHLEKYRKTKLSVAKTAERIVISEKYDEIPEAFGVVSTSRNYSDLYRAIPARVYLTKENGVILKNGKKLISISDITRQEEHNIKNFMMAIAMTDGVVSENSIHKVAKDFQGLRHRCELVLRQNGVDFIDSSIDSTPARTTQTLKSLNRPVVIILGGRGKGLDYAELIPSLKKYAAKVIITGENAREIYGIVDECINAEIIDSFNKAVVRGYELAKDVGALLLSPASTSYDLFKDFEERGNKFKEILLKIEENENNCLQIKEKQSETDLS